jgi:hypothetical protein
MSEVTFSGRAFTAREIDLMREIARDYGGLGVTEIARTVCELLDWKRPSGGLKNHECRLLLEDLQSAGVLALPPVRALGGRGPRKVKGTTAESQPDWIIGSAGAFSSLQLLLVKGQADSRSWRQCVEQHHYLGCPVPYGAHLRYWVRHEGRALACLLWTSPAWRMKPRDTWIGWTDQQRQQNLQRIVNNGRFLILPWVKVRGLASMILARAPASCRGTGRRTMAIGHCCWRRWSMRNALRAPAIAQPTGSMWVRRPAVDAWIASSSDRNR